MNAALDDGDVSSVFRRYEFLDSISKEKPSFFLSAEFSHKIAGLYSLGLVLTFDRVSALGEAGKPSIKG